jgi:NADPH2:quinone reductase
MGDLMKQRVVELAEFGKAENMRLIEADIPSPGPGQIVVKNNAIGLNYLDTYFRSGLYPWPNQEKIKIPGSEGVGFVHAVGSNVVELKEGDKVSYVTPVGAYAEYALINAVHAVQIKVDVNDFDVVACTLKGLTAHYLLHLTFDLKSGMTALVHAAAGGVGQLMGQWGSEIGATMIGTVGGPEKAEAAKKAGYHHVIDYNDKDFVSEVMKITNNQKCDVVYDSVAKSVFPGSMDCLKPRGLWALFGQASGPIVDFNLGLLSAKGSLFVTRPTLFSYIANRDEYNKASLELYSRVADGRLKVAIHDKMPIENIVEAHNLLEGRKTKGAIVITL